MSYSKKNKYKEIEIIEKAKMLLNINKVLDLFFL